MKKKIALLFFYLLLFFCLVLENSASAFRVTPARLELITKRGTTQEVILTLTGSVSVKPETLFVYPTDISMARDGGLKFDRLEGSKNSAVPWIKLEEKDYTLMEKQTKKLKFKISVPMNAVPGEYYSVVMVEPTEFAHIKAKDKQPLMLQMKSRIAVVIIINVPGRIYEKKGEAASASVQEADGKLKILSTFNNAGNIHLDVTGMASIRSKDGKTIFGQTKLMALGANKEEAFIFPGNMRDFEGTLDKQLPNGEYVVDVMFDYGYKFKKAKTSSNFSIASETNLDESKAEFLIVEKKVDIQVPVGALRTKVVKISNSDYRLINVSLASDSWVQVEPKSLTLEPGQSKNIKLTVSNDGKSQKEMTIIVKPDRGLASEIKLSVSEEKSKIKEEGKSK